MLRLPASRRQQHRVIFEALLRKHKRPYHLYRGRPQHSVGLGKRPFTARPVAPEYAPGRGPRLRRPAGRNTGSGRRRRRRDPSQAAWAGARLASRRARSMSSARSCGARRRQLRRCRCRRLPLPPLRRLTLCSPPSPVRPRIEKGAQRRRRGGKSAGVRVGELGEG